MVVRQLNDDAVLKRAQDCVAVERKATAALLATLSELDVRRLFLGEGFSSFFDYCTHSLHLSERAACSRIAAARLARRFPIVLDLIADSRVSLTVVSLLAKHLNEANCLSLLQEATHKTAAEVEVIVARLAPKPDVPSMVRRVAAPSRPATALLAPAPDAAPASDVAPAVMSSAPSAVLPPESTLVAPRPAAVIRPLAPERYKVQFTVSGETRAKLRVVQDLLRHSVPNGDLAIVFDRALSALLADLEKRKLTLVARPRLTARPAKKGTRLIPAAVRRAVWARDKSRCAFAGREGRCRERGGLELHHVKP
ncbi:MAG TPA: hypothetical protein VMN81_00390 [Vicinamibacterales bacterium]|nr:hypothetical protein [Vicinamibacterales bacterium]